MEAAMDVNSRQSEAVLDEHVAWSEINELSISAPPEQRAAKMKSWFEAKRRGYQRRKQMLDS
jgi:hypothetical protein